MAAASFLVLELLQIDHAAVFGAAAIQFIVRTDGLYPAVLDKDDLVQLLHRRNAVGDQQRRLPARLVLRLSRMIFLGAGIDSRDRVVQNQDRRVFQQARAIEMRCFCPPETVTPRSPSTVS